MSEKDLERFLIKVESLNKLVESLDKIPKRRRLLAKCDSHDEVIKLAKSWGFEIGRRWGEY